MRLGRVGSNQALGVAKLVAGMCSNVGYPHAPMPNVPVARLTNPALRERTERYESFRDGGGGMVSKEDVVCRGVQLSAAGDSLVVTAERDGAVVEATSRAMELPADWREFGALSATVAATDVRVKVECSVLGARNRMVAEAWIEPGAETTFRFDLADLPLAAGTRPPFQPSGIKLQIQWGDTWPTAGAWIKANASWPATAANQPVSVELRSVELEARRPDQGFAVVDAFGQRLRGEWPTKVSSDAHFEQVRDDEATWLAETAPPSDRGTFGGWTAGARYAATGFFRVEQDAGRWWYVDPEGYPFWSVGTTGIRVSDTTQLEGREELFGPLPERDGPFAEFYDPPIGSPANDGKGREVVSYYLLNVLRKYGSLDAWCERVIERFQTVGYNTFGNWSDERMMAQRAVAHTRALHTLHGDALLSRGHMPDVFDTEWRRLFVAYLTEVVTPQVDNPWLTGYFVDNEMGWGGVWKQPFVAKPGAAIRSAFADFMQTYYANDLAAASADLGLDLTDWAALAACDETQVPAQATESLVAFAGHYAETYFSIVNHELKAIDPNHLYLGCRFVRRKPHDLICAAAGRHCDVVTVNCYSMIPEPEEFGAWYQATGRPIQIGEHHLPLRSERQLPPLYPAFTSDERREGYERFLRVAAEQAYIVGAHWFQHTDQNATGRPFDGENQTVGFVDIVDRPHPELVGAAMAATRGMYHWHGEAEPVD